MMEPRIVEKPEILIAGFVDSGQSIQDIDIGELWQKFERHSPHIRHQNPDIGYELHIEDVSEPKRHYCMTGVQVSAIEEVPVGMFFKVLPAGHYAVFTHRLADGGFGGIYETMETWLKSSGYVEACPLEIQRFDARFRGPNDPESVIEYHIPIKKR